MKWSSALSEKFSLTEAVAECAYKVHQEIGEDSPDLIVAFVSAHHSPEYETLPQLVQDHFGETVLVGCSGGGIIGAGTEVENRPGFALTAARLPNVTLNPFHIEDEALPDGDAPPHEWEALVSTPSEQNPQFLILADPFSIRGEQLLMGFDYAFPKSVCSDEKRRRI